MPATQEPRNNLYKEWDLGENGWNNQNDANILKMGTLLGLSAIDKDLSAPPGSPADGDTYIVGGSATGLWLGKENQIAIWRDGLGAWEFYDPSLTKGKWLCFIEDENRLVVWNGTNWNLGVTLT